MWPRMWRVLYLNLGGNHRCFIKFCHKSYCHMMGEGGGGGGGGGGRVVGLRQGMLCYAS